MDNQMPNSDKDWRVDALHAVKLDPAVLEAKIKFNKNLNQSVAVEVNHQVKKAFEEQTASLKSNKFEDMMKMQKAALLSLSPHQFNLLLKYADILRIQRVINQKQLECAFCKKNGEPASWYTLHMLKDNRGLVRCPVLRGYLCPGCGATGDKAHTIKYCPLFDRDRWSC